MLQIGKLYYYSGSVRKVTKVTDTHIHMVWGNGQVPRRLCDRTAPIEMMAFFRTL